MKSKYKGHIVYTFSGLILLLILIFLIWVITGIQSERYTQETIPTNEPINSDFSNFYTLSTDVHNQLEKYCGGTYLIRIMAETKGDIGEQPWSTIDLVFFRHIDDSREGGNVYQLTVSIDCVAEKIVGLNIFSGSGHASSPWNTGEISKEILNTYADEKRKNLKPSRQYIFNSDGVRDLNII